MKLAKLAPAEPLYRQAFGDVDVRNFEIYTEQDLIGKVIEVLTDRGSGVCYLAVEIGSWLSRKRVILPLQQFQLLPSKRRIYANGISKAQVENLPVYSEREVVEHNTGLIETALEASSPLEASLPLEGGIRTVSSVSLQPVVELREPANIQPNIQQSPVTSSRYVPVSEETVQLLEERLVVNQHRRKIGEVVVHKVVETRMIEVPVRREKLIVEQVSPERKQLATIDLGDDLRDGIQLNEPVEASSLVAATHEAQPISIQTASELLHKLVQASRFQTAQVKLSFTDSELQNQYEQWQREQHR